MSHMWLTFYCPFRNWSKLCNYAIPFFNISGFERVTWFCSEPAMIWDSRLAFGRTICLLVSFKILFNLDAQIWQWHELHLSPSGNPGRSQVKLFQSSPLAEPCISHKPMECASFVHFIALCNSPEPKTFLSLAIYSRLLCDNAVKECAFAYFHLGVKRPAVGSLNELSAT